MPNTITIKPSSTPSNKIETLPHLASKGAEEASSSPSTPPPFIDRLSVRAAVAPEDGQEVHQAIAAAVADIELFNLCSPQGFVRGYKVRLDSQINSKRWPFISYRGQKGLVSEIRVDFVPVDIGPKGLEELHYALSSWIEGGWNYILKRGRVTRLDVAVDFPQVMLEHLFILPTQGLTTKDWRTDGTLQMIQMGKPKGNTTVVYDRKQKRDAKSAPGHGVSGIRVERRLRVLNYDLQDLLTLKNPFRTFKPVGPSMPQPAGEPKAHRWLQFLDSAQVRGMPAALALLPQKKRTLYRKHLEEFALEWWKPDEVWSRWKHSLQASKLLALHP